MLLNVYAVMQRQVEANEGSSIAVLALARASSWVTAVYAAVDFKSR